ncbi:MAG: hypothetical protein QM802_03010 [Agriterribacter sp.]
MMKTILRLLLLLIFSFQGYVCIAQSYAATPRSVPINDNCGGFYEFLPASYNESANASAKYPLLIDITGSGGEGDGSLQSLSRLLNFDAAYFIQRGSFPDTFYANGNAYSFVVISPQFSSRGSGADVKAVIDYIIDRYRIDESRIYLAGYSNGGQPAWSFPAMGADNAERIAALVPVAAVNTNTNHDGVHYFVESKLPVWALHSTEDRGDDTNVANSVAFVNAINDLNPAIPAELTLLTGTHRETMSNVFDPDKRYTVGNQNLNIYEWMLQYQRVSSTLPVSLLSFNAAVVNASTVRLNWTTTAEFNNSFFTVEKSTDADFFSEVGKIPSKGNSSSGLTYNWLDMNPVEGINYYRLSQTDQDGKKVYFNIVSVTITNAEASIKAYPTIIGNEPLKIQVNDLNSDKIDITVVDTNGRMIYKNSFINQTSFFIPSSSLNTGLNVVNIQTNNITRKIRVLKNL